MPSLVAFGETTLRFSPPDPDRLETADRLRVRTAGAASNVAVAACRLGTDAVWLSSVADTPLGRRAVAELRGHGLDTDVHWTEDGDARQALAFYERGRDPRPAVTIDDRDGTALASVVPGDIDMSTVQNAGAAYVSGESVALSEAAAETAKAVLRACGGTSVFGLDHRAESWASDDAVSTYRDLFEHVDVLVTSESDATSVLEKSGTEHEMAHQIASEWDFETVVITRSDDGAVVWHDQTIHEREGLETEVVDASGDRDAFVGAFLGQRLAGEGIEDALKHGIAASALTRTIDGAVPAISREEVTDLIWVL